MKHKFNDSVEALYDDFAKLYVEKKLANEKYKDTEKKLAKLEKDWEEAKEAFDIFDEYFSTLNPLAKIFAFNKYQKLQQDHFYKRNLFNDFNPGNYQSDFFAADIECRFAAVKFAEALYEIRG